MRLDFSLHRDVREEFRKSIIYYKDNAPPQIAAEFLDAVDAAIEFLRDHPLSAPLVFKDVRRKVIPKFPFTVYYYVRDTRLRVIAIAHQSRRPYYWIGRE